MNASNKMKAPLKVIQEFLFFKLSENSQTSKLVKWHNLKKPNKYVMQTQCIIYKIDYYF